MKINKRKNNLKTTGSSLGFKTNIRGRKLLRKQKRLQKKQNRAAFTARLMRGQKAGIEQALVTTTSKVKQLKVMVEAEKVKVKEGKEGEPAEKSEKVNEEGNESCEEEVDGFRPSTASKSERMARLQEFVNQEAGIGESSNQSNQNTKQGSSDQKIDEKKLNLIKDKKKLKHLRFEQKEDTKEINKLARLLRISKPQKKKVAPLFAEDFGSLLQDIENGSMENVERYKAEGTGGDGDKDFERDMATALGKDVKQEKKKSKVSEEAKEDKGKKPKKGNYGGSNKDPENEFTAKDFNLYAGGNASDDEEEYEDDAFGDEYGDDGDGYERDSGSRKYGKFPATSLENGDEYDDVEGDDEAQEGKFSSDGEEGGYSDGRFGDNDERDESEDGRFSSEEEREFEDRRDESKFSDYGDEDKERITSKFSDGDEERDYTKFSDLENEEEAEEEEEEDGFFDSQAEEDSEADEESDNDGKLFHDFTKEPEYAFEGGSGYYSKPEILKNGEENEIDRYSSNTEDDEDLEGFVVDDAEVEYENVVDELPDELSDSPSPIRSRKKTRIIMHSDDESDEKSGGDGGDEKSGGDGGDEKSGGDDGDEEGDSDGAEDFFFCARGMKSKGLKGKNVTEGLNSTNEGEEQEKGQDRSSENGSDDDLVSGKSTDGRKVKGKGKEVKVKKMKPIILDDSDVLNSSVDNATPREPGQENEDTPPSQSKKIILESGSNVDVTIQSEDITPIKTKKEKKVEGEDNEDNSTMDSEDITPVKTKKKKKVVEDEDNEDNSTMDSEDITPVKTKKKKKVVEDEDNEGNSTMDGEDITPIKTKKKLDKDNEENSTMDSQDTTPIKTKKKKKKLEGEDDEDNSTMDSEDPQQIKGEKKKKKVEHEDNPTVDSEDARQVKTKKKKKLEDDHTEDNTTTDSLDVSRITKLDGNDADISAVDSEDITRIKLKKKKKKKRAFVDEIDEEDSTMDSEDIPQIISQMKKKNLENNTSDFTTPDIEFLPQMKKKNLDNTSDFSTPDIEFVSHIKAKKKSAKRKLEEESNEDIFADNSEETSTTEPKKKKKKRKFDGVSPMESDDATEMKAVRQKKKIDESSDDVLVKEKKAEARMAAQDSLKPTSKHMKVMLDKSKKGKVKEEPKMKAKCDKKLLPLPVISEEGEEEEEEDEEDDSEEEGGDMEEEEDEGDMEEEESDIEEEEEEEEEEEDMDGEEEEEEEEVEDVEKTRYQSNTSTNEKTDDDESLMEDIYGRLRDRHGNIITRKERESTGQDSRYIPPALRKLSALNRSKEKKEQLAALKRTLKGLVNRLAESNMGGIAGEIESMYLRHARNDVSEIMTILLMEAVVGLALTPERLVQELALLVALLSANVSSEVGAHILNEFVLRWSDEMERLTLEMEGGSKELDNLLLFICHLYCFRVVEARLIYDILHRLALGFSGKEVELILLVLRSVGFNLRKDDPLALKALITKIQTKAAEVQEASMTATGGKEAAGSSKATGGKEAAGSSKATGGGKMKGGSEGTEYSRVTFMLEMIQAVRNNNMSKLPNYDPTHTDHLKQVLRGLVRKGRQPAQLNVTLEDMLRARECGRWWVVGSAWSGGLIGEKTDQHSGSTSSKSKKSALETKFSDAFMRKATKLQLQRPPRVNILYILTEGSEDYLDAFEKLLQLSLPQQQERELFSVILLCCQKGKVYNPFFSYLSDRMCKFHKKYSRLLQFALWDKFEELETIKVREVSNLAKFLTHLIGESSLNLTIFKHVSFMDAEKQTISLIRQVLITLLLHPVGSDAIKRIFSILSVSPKLKVLRQSLRIFILKFIKGKSDSEDMNLAMLSKRIKAAVEILSQGGGVRL